MENLTDSLAFPVLDDSELDLLRKAGRVQRLADGQTAYKAGDADVDFFVVESGLLDMVNPTDHDRVIATHTAGHFVGDIDLLTRRPVIVTGVARGPTTLIRVPGDKLRRMLNTVPKLSEKLLVAFQVRRRLLEDAGVAGLQVVGPAQCGDTNRVREFLHKNFVPFVWFDTGEPAGKARRAALPADTRIPAVVCGNGTILSRPTLRELSTAAGVWRECPKEVFDFAVVGGGPAGMAAAVYAASEGLNTIVLDRLGPGGQAGGSSKIENFIGFPSGLSGTELATRAVLQMLKFGATLVTPVEVQRLEIAAADDQPHKLHLDCGGFVQARVVFISTGVAWRKLGVPNAEKFEQAGVYYACTTVEAQTYQGMDVAVVGAGNSAGQAAMFLSETCARRVHLLVRRGNLGDDMSEYLTDRIGNMPNITVHYFTEVTGLNGTYCVDSIDILCKTDGTSERLDCKAVFVFIGSEPHADWLPADIKRDDLGFLLTGTEVAKSGAWPLPGRDPCPLETTVPRVIAGGDVRSGTTKRVGFAVGDGSMAVTCAHKLLTIR